MKILFVDAKTNELNALAQRFKDSHQQVAVVSDAYAAIEALTKAKFDVVISLLSLPKIDGIELFNTISDKFPSMVRVLINDTVATLEPKQLSNSAHYVYQLPVDIHDIVTTITELKDSRSLITKEAIIKAVAQVKTLPSPPKVYMQLNAMLKDSATDSQKISEVIAQDPALTAKVLQFSNNTFMTKGKSLNSIADAITKMGVDTLCCIVMTAELFSYEPNIADFSLIEEQLHGLSTARLAASMVKAELKQQAMLAGLLHDIGKLVLYEMDPALTKKYFQHRSATSDNTLLENKIFGTNHSHIGGYLLHMWSFSYSLIEAIILHHAPQKLLGSSFGVAQAVYVADKLLREQEIDAKLITHYKLESVLDKLSQRAIKFKH